jgi:hypothetical protein
MSTHSEGRRVMHDGYQSPTNCTPKAIPKIHKARILVVAALLTCVGLLQDSKILAQESHLVAAQFQAGPTDGQLTLMFSVSPAVRDLPIVRWLRAAGGEAKTLEVKKDPKGRYSAALGDVSHAIDGQVLIDLSDSEAGTHELHSVDFALREIITKGPSMSPSRDGHFVVYTKPTDASGVMRLIISSTEQPLEALPPGVSNSDVIGAYSITFISPIDTPKDWQLTIANPADEKLAIFYLAKSGAAWESLKSAPVEGHPFLGAAVPGPGTYLLVQEVKQ